MQLRNYQSANAHEIKAAWQQGHRNVLYVLPTGGGKTVTFAHIAAEEKGTVCASAHRQELVGQIANAFAREGIRHHILAPRDVLKDIVRAQTFEYGKSYFDPAAKIVVAGTDTLLSRKDDLRQWASTVSLWIGDEAHHIIPTNKWGQMAAMFSNARGLGVTATPRRTDGKPLDGVFHHMVLGPTMRSLITEGYLSDYRIFAPPSDLDLSKVAISAATGDYSQPKLVQAVHQSHILGDIVAHYLRIAPGKLGVTFATDIESATDIAERFNAAGVPAEVITSKTTNGDRTAALRKLRNRQILQLVNVDIFGEGFDLPAIEVVSMGRPTMSLSLYIQQFGRGLRVMDGKPHAIILDHVGNVMRHGLPDAPRDWSLSEVRSKRSNTESEVKMRTCMSCFAVYPRVVRDCPFCGWAFVPADRGCPAHVDGDLTELDPATLARMRGDAEVRMVSDEAERDRLVSRNVPHLGVLAGVKRHREDREAQTALRETIALWAGLQRSRNVPDAQSYREFYLTFGIDVLGAQALKHDDANNLTIKVLHDLNKRMGI